MRPLLKLPSLSRVVAGSVATLECPLGPTYQKINFQASGTSLSADHIERIEVLIDGKTVQTFRNVQRLIDLNAYYGRSTDTVEDFTLHFFRAELENNTWRRASGLGTADVQTMHVEITLAADAPADIEITAYSRTSEPAELGVFFKIREYPYASSVAGEVEIDKLPRGAWYGAIHLFKADISKVTVEADQKKVIEATKTVLETDQKQASPVPRAPVTAKATHIDFLIEGDLRQALKTAGLQDFRIKPELDTAGSVDIVAETLDTLGG